MNKFYGSLIGAAFAVGLVALNVGPVNAQAVEGDASGKNCVVETVGTQNGAGGPHSKFVIKDNRAIIKFKVIGNDNCKPTVALKSWYSPSASGKPHNEQKLYTSVTRSFGPGQHQMSVELPPIGCFYQVDFVRVVNHAPGEHNEMLGYVLDGKKNCIVPPTNPPTPDTPVVQGVETVAPKAIASTGPEALIAQLFGTGSLAASAAYYWQSRKNRS